MSAFLLQVPLMPTLHAYVVYMLPAAALLFTVYSFFSRESSAGRAKREAEALVAQNAAADREERVKNNSRRLDSHEHRFEGMIAEHTRHCEEVANQFAANKVKLDEIMPIRESIVEMRSQMRYMSESYAKLEVKIDRLIERLTRP
jgi:hypothetical protein